MQTATNILLKRDVLKRNHQNYCLLNTKKRFVNISRLSFQLQTNRLKIHKSNQSVEKSKETLFWLLQVKSRLNLEQVQNMVKMLQKCSFY